MADERTEAPEPTLVTGSTHRRAKIVAGVLACLGAVVAAYLALNAGSDDNKDSDDGCDKCSHDDPQRTGASCHDGSDSTATSHGACSSHGGVDTWKHD